MIGLGVRTLAGRYELREVIGRGGMGTVYRAVDLVLDREVAVKTLPWMLADEDPTHVARFNREARAAAQLSHPAVVSVYDTGADGTTHYIVMELVAGRSLDAALRSDGAFDPRRAAAVAASIADALAAAHAAGIVHRDIKPANVMIATDGRVKVLDFGIARASGLTTLTQSSSLVGTAAYMSPEQGLGKPADGRSDIYALGCVLYALLTGRPPFTGDGAAAILGQHANSVAPPPADVNADVSPALSALTMQMLAKAPEERPQSASEVRDRLRASAAAAAGVAGRVVPVGAVAAGAAEPTGRTRRLPPGAVPVAGAERAAVDDASFRRRALAVGAIVGAVLLVALVLFASSANAPRRAAAVTRHRPASALTTRRPTVARTATKTPAKRSASPKTAAPPVTAPHPPTVDGAARALNALLVRDVAAGTIDPAVGQQMATGISAILHTWEMNGTAAAQHQLTDLTGQVGTLEQQGKIAAAAAPGLSQALANVGTALGTTTPPNPPAGGPGPAAGPPGHGGTPPGQAKKHGGDGNSQGD